MPLLTWSTVPPFLSASLFLMLGLVVLFKSRSKKIGRLFFLMALVTAWWQASWFILFNINKNLIFAELMVRVGYFGIIFIPIIFFNFFVVYLQSMLELKSKRLDFSILVISYLLALFFVFELCFSNNFIDSYYIFSWGYYPKAGPLHIYYLIMLVLLAVRMLIVLLRAFMNTRLISDSKHSQIKYFLIAQIFYNFASIDFVTNYGVNVYPFGFIFVLIFLFIIGYSIVSYRLMDVKLVLRSYSVYLTSLILTLVPAFLFKYLVSIFLPTTNYFIDFIIIVLALAIFPYFKDKVYRFANKYFFSSLYDANEVIARFSKNLSSTLESDRINKAIEDALAGALHPKALALFDYDDKTKLFNVKFNSGLKLASNSLEVGKNVLQKIFSSSGVVILEDLINGANKPNTWIKDFRGKLGIEIVVPLLIKDKLVGFLALGAKESGDAYNSEDVQFLSVIGTQLAMSLENSWLYEEARQFNVKLQKEVEKATKDLVQANVELKKLDEAKSEFISIASHQLRTPLTVIKGYVSMMIDGDFGEINLTVDENLHKVYESNERLIRLVEDLLNVSRIESGRLQFNYEPSTLTEVVDSVMEEMQGPASKKKLYLEYKKPTAALPSQLLDKDKLRQVIINMIDNAIKYTKTGGVTVKIDLTDDKKAVNFCVSDTGMGIRAEDLPNLFKKFSRGTGTSLIHTEGTGLGLYVGRMMVEAHQGKIWAESTGEGRGSKFCFSLPLGIKLENTPMAPIQQGALDANSHSDVTKKV